MSALPTPSEAFKATFEAVIAGYKRRWWRWYISSFWRDMAYIDAQHQAEQAFRWVSRRRQRV